MQSSLYAYDAANRLLQAGDTTYTYDNNGNRITEEDSDGHHSIYSYDAANRLVQVVKGRTELNYTYDGDGNKVEQSISRREKTEMVYFLNDVATALPVVLQEEGPRTNIDYVYGLGLINEEVTRHDSKPHSHHSQPYSHHSRPYSKAFFYHADGLGSTVALTERYGHLEARYEYDTWGNLTRESEDVPNRFLFTGEEQDEETGLYYLRARWYDPRVGRFLTKDRFLEKGRSPLNINPYLYVANNPITRIDPLGLWYIDIGVSGGIFKFIGIEGGIIISSTGIYGYGGGGGGIGSPIGGQILYSPEDVTTGIQYSQTSGFIFGAQIDLAKGPESGAVGLVCCGVSVDVTTVFPIFTWKSVPKLSPVSQEGNLSITSYQPIVINILSNQNAGTILTPALKGK